MGRLVSGLIQEHKMERFGDLAAANKHPLRSTVARLAIHEANPYCNSISWTYGSQSLRFDTTVNCSSYYVCLYFHNHVPSLEPAPTDSVLIQIQDLSTVCLFVAGGIRGRKHIWNNMGIGYCVLGVWVARRCGQHPVCANFYRCTPPSYFGLLL